MEKSIQENGIFGFLLQGKIIILKLIFEIINSDILLIRGKINLINDTHNVIKRDEK